MLVIFYYLERESYKATVLIFTLNIDLNINLKQKVKLNHLFIRLIPFKFYIYEIKPLMTVRFSKIYLFKKIFSKFQKNYQYLDS